MAASIFLNIQVLPVFAAYFAKVVAGFMRIPWFLLQEARGLTALASVQLKGSGIWIFLGLCRHVLQRAGADRGPDSSLGSGSNAFFARKDM